MNKSISACLVCVYDLALLPRHTLTYLKVNDGLQMKPRFWGLGGEA